MPVLMQPKLVQLREDISSAFVGRVDRDRGIIFGVKLLGKHSPNTHGIDGVTGTEYTDDALRGAVQVYEGRKVNIDHPPRDNPTKDRSAYDRIGKLFNVRVQEDGLYADLKMLKKHPMADRVMEAAETMPDAYGLSHNALGRGTVKDGRYIITEIPTVRSVDLVADAGTTRSLFESEQPIPETKTIRQALESLLPDAKPRLNRLFEMGDYLKPDMAMGDAPPAAGEEAGHEEHLGNAVVAILKDDSLDMAAKRKKVLAVLKLLDDDGGDKDAAAPVAEGDEEKKDEPKKDADTKESLRLKQENAALRLCMESGVKASAVQLKALAGLSQETEMKELVESFRLPGVTPERPKSQSPGPARTAVVKPKNTDEFVNRLLSRN